MKALSRYVRLTHAPGASHVAYKTSADVVGKAVTLMVTVAAARTLGSEDFGVMALAMTTGWLLGVASDAGLPMYLATRVARVHLTGAPVYPLVSAVFVWRWRLTGLATLAAITFSVSLLPARFLLPFTLIVLHQLLGAMLETVAHAFRGLGRTDIESSVSLAYRGTMALAALSVLAVQPTLLALGLALALPALVALLASLAVARTVTASGPRVTLSRRTLASEIAPLGLGVLLSALYFRCDVYFLERLHGVETVGAYNAAFRIVDALRLFPAAALAVAYPLLCAAADARRVRQLSLGLLAASVVIGSTIFFSARPLLVLVYGEAFAHASAPLQVLALCVPLFYVNYALTQQVIAWGYERRYLAIATAALTANLAGNAWLIPAGAMTGAAISTLLTELVVFGGAVAALRR